MNWLSGFFVVLILFVIPITLAKTADTLHQRLFRKWPDKVVFLLLVITTILFEALLTWTVAWQTEMSYGDSHFTVSFLLLILVWFMEFNREMENREATSQNVGFGSGEKTYEIEAFSFRVTPISIGMGLYFAAGLIFFLLL
ncbi:hypothetical protein [Salimicrobium halophilum]|uniref:Uncharacterized protein n=1 Tax=Salimicrobium halophilum TaxID=86666 RepID=A0A1G8R3J2_9BACI|nr:hypothetical protein [Salimicrobium halophilum]SDJ11554.1 hypothetical protein SAMN04490247_0800 [Salimicrobium halophilum]